MDPTAPPLKDWEPDDPISAARLNLVNDAANSAQLVADAASGIETHRGPSGTAVRMKKPLEIWVKITGGGTSGYYDGTQQIEASSTGGWANGPRTFTAASQRLREANANATVPNGGTIIVRAYRDRYCWRFVYGTC